jgi:hypothetical protein
MRFNRSRSRPRPQGFGATNQAQLKLLGPFIAAADALGLPSWLERGEWFTATDPELLKLQALAVAQHGALPRALGVSPGETAIDTLRALLWSCGHQLEIKPCRKQPYDCVFRVVMTPLPDGVVRAQLEAKWMEELRNPLASPPWMQS